MNRDDCSRRINHVACRISRIQSYEYQIARRGRGRARYIVIHRTGPLHFVLEMEGLFNNFSKTKIVSFDLELMRPSESTFGIKVENNIGAEVNETAVFVHNIEYDNENGLAPVREVSELLN